MKVADLGVLNSPLALFGGPYSNAQATAAFFDALLAHGASPDTAICTGDVVAYCGDPRGTIDRVRASGCTVVAGNCERQLAQRASDCGCGFEPGTRCDTLSAGWYAFADAQVTGEDRRWMGTCPDIAVFSHQGQRYAVLHGGVSDVSRFIWSTSAEEIFLQEIAAVSRLVGPVDAVIAGHSGLPFQRDVNNVRWINAGVIGMPPHDGRQMTRYAVLDGGEMTFQLLHYNVQAAVSQMATAGLTQGYDRALATGYWPSEEVLPSDLRGLSLASG